MSIRSTLRAALAALVLALAAPVAPAPAVAQDSLSSALQRLQQNPRYQGRVLGTHIRKSDQSSEGYVYEVRILRPDDRVVLVYVDPNGRVIGDSGRAQPRA
ncbi:MAG: PepSY domain-containing protein, partial [Rhodobacterales bacterium]|nr:PepSY domain-containing protein [Rhodobacterales bacterium]